MVSPATPQALHVMMATNTAPTTDTPPHKQDSAVHVQASAESQTSSQDYQRWPQRAPLGALIEPEKSSLEQALEKLNTNMQAWSTGLRFDVDDDTQKLIVSLVDSESGEVIRTVPSDTALQISKMIAKFKGNSINTKA